MYAASSPVIVIATTIVGKGRPGWADGDHNAPGSGELEAIPDECQLLGQEKKSAKRAIGQLTSLTSTRFDIAFDERPKASPNE